MVFLLLLLLFACAPCKASRGAAAGASLRGSSAEGCPLSKPVFGASSPPTLGPSGPKRVWDASSHAIRRARRICCRLRATPTLAASCRLRRRLRSSIAGIAAARLCAAFQPGPAPPRLAHPGCATADSDRDTNEEDVTNREARENEELAATLEEPVEGQTP
eukprot:GHVT01075852.1.p3 GENE.GHVT01075852.1~~GHVT01075852.1.p3  ORF type:complete len:161 (+),score=37.56 GHVT01075852.1:2955-3437(+)